MSLINCDNVTFIYENSIALKDISFTLDSGDFLSILGRNGAGKSTLMKGILKLKNPISGEITFSKDLRPNEIGYLSQKNLAKKDFPASVKEVVISGCLNRLNKRLFYGKDEKKVMNEKMEQLGILNLKNKSFSELSGGEQQRVLLARALCATKNLLLLDEPVTGLDPNVTNELYELISNLNKKHGLTVIMISHDIDGSLKYSNKVLHLDVSTLFFGSVDEYRNSNVYVQFTGGNQNAW